MILYDLDDIPGLDWIGQFVRASARALVQLERMDGASPSQRFHSEDTMTDVPALLDAVERLREKLADAITVIEGYQLDLRNSQEVLTPNILTALANGASLADIGFCQGSIYAEALARLNR